MFKLSAGQKFIVYLFFIFAVVFGFVSIDYLEYKKLHSQGNIVYGVVDTLYTVYDESVPLYTYIGSFTIDDREFQFTNYHHTSTKEYSIKDSIKIIYDKSNPTINQIYSQDEDNSKVFSFWFMFSLVLGCIVTFILLGKKNKRKYT